jgi:hypothetical protein
MSEDICGGALPLTIAFRWSVGRHIWQILLPFAVLWVLVFGILSVQLCFTGISLDRILAVGRDAAGGATLVDAVTLILSWILPPN